MFGKKNSVQISSELCKKSVSAFLLLSFLTFTITSSARAAVDPSSRKTVKPAPKKMIAADLKLDHFEAARFSGAIKLSWKTSYEQNAVGFKVWREDGGQKQPVNEDLIAGSLLKVSNGILPAGGEYNFVDRTNSQTAFYWLEAIDINAKSSWFGPVFPNQSYEKTSLTDESATVSEINAAATGQRQQIERVDLPATRKAVKSNISAEKAFQSSAVEMMTTDPNALKIEVRNRGIYRIGADSLAEMGFGSQLAGNWKLFSGGVEQPMVVNPDGSLEFFGNPIDTLQTDANVYWLVPDTTGGQRINRVPVTYIDSANDVFYNHTAERRDKTLRFSSVLNGARENWFGALIGSTESTHTLSLSDIATESGATANLRIDLQGVTNYAHQVSVILNGVSVGQINFQLFGRTEWTTAVPLSSLREGVNNISLRGLGGSSDFSVTEMIRITYPRRMKAQNNRLEFSLAGGNTVKLRNFTTPNVRVFDVTNPAQVVEYAPESRQETDGTYTVAIPAAASSRLMIAQGETAEFFSATPLIRNTPSNLRSAQNQAKFVIITPREFAKAFWQLRDLRRWQGIPTEIVDIEDIYDEFNYGIRSAEAIRSFLQYAKQNWTIKPDYALFGGDATVDPRNYSGQGGNSANRVPTMFTDTWNMETVSDAMMADFNGDDIEEISIGRFPGETDEEIEMMTQRAINFSPMTRDELTSRGVHFVSDAFIGYDFAAGSRNAAGTIPSDITVNYLDRTTQDAAAMRTDIANRINAGAAIVNYFGHASTGAWTGAQIWRSADAQSLFNQKRQPLMVMLACLNGNFAETGVKGVAEAMMKRRLGGALSVWAASGWNTAQAQEYMAREFYERVFAGMPMGDAAREAKATTEFIDQRRTYVFFGDPTQPLLLP